MQCFINYQELVAPRERSRIVTIGNFDGVHLGHQAVLTQARSEADRAGLEVAVLTFEPHPAEFLRPGMPRQRLLEPGRKTALLASLGADVVLAQRFDARFANLPAARFASDVLVKALGAGQVLVGDNFRFGRGREGDVAELRRQGEALGFTVKGEPLVRFGDEAVSSSRIRQLLVAGDVATARALLGRPHEIAGEVIQGRGAGKGLGYPTINLGGVSVLVPGAGIYAAFCDIGDQREQAAVYIGDRPTLGYGYTIEAFLLDYSGDLYGRRVVLRLVDRVRGDRKFASPAELVQQIAIDVEQARAILKV